LAENQNSSDRTKHVDIRYHFIRQYIKEGTIEFVRSSENDSDIFTKNVTSETFNKHVKKLIWKKEEYKAETRILTTGRVLRGIAYNSSTKGKCVNTNKSKSKITKNCESEKWGSTYRHNTAKIDCVSKENTEKENNNKKISFNNVTEET